MPRSSLRWRNCSTSTRRLRFAVVHLSLNVSLSGNGRSLCGGSALEGLGTVHVLLIAAETTAASYPVSSSTHVADKRPAKTVRNLCLTFIDRRSRRSWCACREATLMYRDVRVTHSGPCCGYPPDIHARSRSGQRTRTSITSGRS